MKICFYSSVFCVILYFLSVWKFKNRCFFKSIHYIRLMLKIKSSWLRLMGEVAKQSFGGGRDSGMNLI